MENIKELSSFFGSADVEQVLQDKSIFRWIKKSSKEKEYQYLYIDLTNNWVNENVTEHIESVVKDDYYKNPNYLQWNFYYYFISPQSIITEDKKKKKEVEKDDAYARKTILTDEEFLSWLKSLERISNTTATDLTEDLYSIWINYLKNKNLSFIYSENSSNYKQLVEDYISGNLIVEEELEQVRNEENYSYILNKLSTLELKKYRTFPLRKNFSFGKVNLITGPNAVGKTSFLSSIELLITGSLNITIRSELEYSIEGKDSNGFKLSYPEKRPIYKERDIYWYNSGINRGNNLNVNFNRFNYYTSDAAFELRQKDENERYNLEEIITDIALGREVNKLEERIEGFRKRFEDAVNLYDKEINKIKGSLESRNSVLNDLHNKVINVDSYKAILLREISQNKWKILLSENEDEFIAETDNILQTTISNIKRIKTIINDFESTSVEKLVDKLNNVKTKKIVVDRLNQEIQFLKGEKQSKELELQKHELILSVVEKLKPFFNNEYFNYIVGLDKLLEEKSREFNRFTEIEEKAKQISSLDLFQNVLSKELPSEEMYEKISERAEVNRVNLNQAKQKLKDLQESIDEITDIVSEIKSLGKNYLTLREGEGHEVDCPLCNTHYSRIELIDRINAMNIEGALSQSYLAMSIKDEVSYYNKELEHSKEMLDRVHELKMLSFLLFGDNSKKNLREVYEEVESAIGKLKELNDELIQLNVIKGNLNINGLEEKVLLTELQKVGELTNIELKNKEQFEKLLIDAAQNVVNTTSYLSTLNQTLTSKQEGLDNSFDPSIRDYDTLLLQSNWIVEIESALKQLNSYLHLGQELSLITIKERIESLENVFTSFKNAYYDSKKRNQSVEVVKQEIESFTADLELNEKERERAQHAFDQLSTLLLHYSKNQYLQRYIQSNKQEIVEIFKLIHAPNEFMDIDFQDGKLFVLTNESQRRFISEISTGQRAALPISIFLSLNKKLPKGPNIILFDDPVSYVDDLNILSFLDYLRELVLTADRQIFFVTANEDLAFLFAKKFEFLLEELVSIQLDRE